MGDIMTTNIGPLGETYQYFYSCGPVLDAENPDYYLDPSYEKELCVRAGTIQYGAEWEQNIAIGLTYFTIISSLILFVYYSWQTYKATCGWEEMYVVTAESTLFKLNHEFQVVIPVNSAHAHEETSDMLKISIFILFKYSAYFFFCLRVVLNVVAVAYR